MKYGKVKAGPTAPKGVSSVASSYSSAPALPAVLSVLYQIPFWLESLGHLEGFGSLFGTLTAEWISQGSPGSSVRESATGRQRRPAGETRTVDCCEPLSWRPESP